MVQSHVRPLPGGGKYDGRMTPTPSASFSLTLRIRIRNGVPVSYEDFITGFQGADGRRFGRPVDILVLKDGSLLLSDDDAGMVYRVHK